MGERRKEHRDNHLAENCEIKKKIQGHITSQYFTLENRVFCPLLYMFTMTTS